VVLLHGLCLDQSSWDIQIGQLTCKWGNDIRIISYDHRGHGDSADAPMHTYRIEQLADDLATLDRSFPPPKKATSLDML